jgi:uncharacterized membrane protein
MQKGAVYIVLLLIVLPFSLAASLHGKVYDYSFRLATNSVVRINTLPEQVVVAVDGAYSFNVPLGEYVIAASLRDASNTTTYYVEDNISIIKDGDYVRDLIMFPSDDLEDLELENDYSTELNGEVKTVTKQIVLILTGVIIVIMFLWAYCVALKKCKLLGRFSKKEKLADKAGKFEAETEADDLGELADFIRKNKRVKQKDIRKEFPMSEAKISLMLTDLESQGKIRKIKKGRGNIIVWNG